MSILKNVHYKFEGSNNWQDNSLIVKTNSKKNFSLNSFRSSIPSNSDSVSDSHHLSSQQPSLIIMHLSRTYSLSTKECHPRAHITNHSARNLLVSFHRNACFIFRPFPSHSSVKNRGLGLLIIQIRVIYYFTSIRHHIGLSKNICHVNHHRVPHPSRRISKQ